MRQVFIKGTNEQYSIREDGVVIRHYRFVSNQYNHVKKYYKDRICKPYFILNTLHVKIGNNPKSVARLMLYHFTEYKKEYKKTTPIIYIDSDRTNCKLSNLLLFDTEKGKKISRLKHKNSESFRNNLDSRRKSNKIQTKRKILLISKSYVALKLFKFEHVKDLSDELYEFHKASLKLKRLIKYKSKVKANENKHTQLSGANDCIM